MKQLHNYSNLQHELIQNGEKGKKCNEDNCFLITWKSFPKLAVYTVNRNKSVVIKAQPGVMH